MEKRKKKEDDEAAAAEAAAGPWASVPIDLLPEILSRVPYRSLCRFNCVSRAWLALCSDPARRPEKVSPDALRLLLLPRQQPRPPLAPRLPQPVRAGAAAGRPLAQFRARLPRGHSRLCTAAAASSSATAGEST
nr:F-box protein At3g49450-like [Lolium perenne]